MQTESNQTANEALHGLTGKLRQLIEQHTGAVFNLALSGGETAKQMFALWTDEYRDVIPWERLCFYWVDERCVPKDHEQSNYGQAKRLLFDPLQIPKKQIHRIKGENYPPAEAARYSLKIAEKLPIRNGLPRFDCIILGVGNDAHTASIFPTEMKLLTDEKLYSIAQHPETKQFRITITGPLLLNGVPLLVPLLGKEKEAVIQKLQAGYSTDAPTPATYILSKSPDATLYTG